jgi:uncharacterized protein
MFTEFIDLARLGRNQWWRYLLGWMVILTGWVGGYFVGKLILSAWAEVDFIADSAMFKLVYWYIYSFIYHVNLGMLAMLVFILVVVRVLHQRPIRSIVTANAHLDWKRLTQGFGLYFLLLIAASVVEYLCAPSSLRFRINLPQLSGTASTALVGIITTATAEELFFRGYMLQGLGLLTRNRMVLASISGFLFMAAHAPLEESSNRLFLLSCFEMGFFLTIITLKSNGLELAIGMHIAHNLAADLIHWSTQYQPVYWTILFPLGAMIMYLLVFRRKAITYPETATSPG